MIELLVTVLRGLGGASSIFFPLCTQLICKENVIYDSATIMMIKEKGCIGSVKILLPIQTLIFIENSDNK